MKYTFIVLFVIKVLYCQAQEIQFSKDIAPIFFSKCSYCHQKNGAAPFPLTNYTEIDNNILTILYCVTHNIMPPWKATDGDRYINCRSISKEEVEMISAWAKQGHKNDNVSTSYYKNKRTVFDETEKPDLILKVSKPYFLKTDGTEEFVSFVLHPNLKEDKLIRKIAIKPGNKKVVHHARLEMEENGIFDKIIGSQNFFYTNTISDTILLNAAKIAFYVPGLHYLKFPFNTGITIKSNTTLALHIHYAPSFKETNDQTEVWLYFAKRNLNTRNIFCDAKTMLDNKVNLPKNKITQLIYDCTPFEDSITILAVEPHMHLIGKTFLAELIMPDSSEIYKLIEIPNWDFNWQEFYFYKKAIIAPKGSHIRLTAVYENTTNNPKNPFYPPRDVDFGAMNTTNEMLGLLVQYLNYNQGDETLDFSTQY